MKSSNSSLWKLYGSHNIALQSFWENQDQLNTTDTFHNSHSWADDDVKRHIESKENVRPIPPIMLMYIKSTIYSYCDKF